MASQTPYIAPGRCANATMFIKLLLCGTLRQPKWPRCDDRMTPLDRQPGFLSSLLHTDFLQERVELFIEVTKVGAT